MGSAWRGKTSRRDVSPPTNALSSPWRKAAEGTKLTTALTLLSRLRTRGNIRLDPHMRSSCWQRQFFLQMHMKASWLILHQIELSDVGIIEPKKSQLASILKHVLTC